jgi:hypothetical protein
MKQKGFLQQFVRDRGISPFVGTALGIVLVVFFALYGERLNPWDGKTWSDFDNEPQSIAKISIESLPLGSVLVTTTPGCEVLDSDGKPFALQPNYQTEKVMISKGTTFSEECFLVKDDRQ